MFCDLNAFRNCLFIERIKVKGTRSFCVLYYKSDRISYTFYFIDKRKNYPLKHLFELKYNF